MTIAHRRLPLLDIFHFVHASSFAILPISCDLHQPLPSRQDEPVHMKHAPTQLRFALPCLSPGLGSFPHIAQTSPRVYLPEFPSLASISRFDCWELGSLGWLSDVMCMCVVRVFGLPVVLGQARRRVVIIINLFNLVLSLSTWYLRTPRATYLPLS
ncbi:hypothetical protein QBC45DRAFT_39456 [Copromyces sp. CBS 386.78]|nr:hypothetical protein QBC45DRAFT_39456 [Copromyces sp. CBS 386.78]